MAATLSFQGKVQKALHVGFNCPGGWAVVAQHFDASMLRQGYTDQAARMTAELRGMPDIPASSGIFSLSRMYTKVASKFTVLLVDMGSPTHAQPTAEEQAMLSGMPEMFDFLLIVVKVE